jgi:Predicted permeases
MVNSLINTQITIMIYLLVGFTLYKVKLIDNYSQLFLSNMTINVLLPASVFVSFLHSMSMDLLTSMAAILALAIVFEIALYLFTKIPTGKLFSPSESCVAHYGYLVSNGGLVGTPVIGVLFGDTGVMLCNIFMIPTRIMAYSAGESIFNPSLKRGKKDIILALVTNKVIIVMALGLIMVLFHLSLPAPVLTALEKIGGCLSPFSLMLVGSMLAQKVHISKIMMRNISIITIIRLIIIPLCALLICKILNLDFETTSIITLLLGMPVGSSCASFAKKYKGNETFASSVVFVSTVLSIVTLVLLMSVIEMCF